jgi:ribosome-associated protein
MNTEQLKILALAALEDLKAIDLITIDVRGITSLADFMIICTGRSNRHVKSLAENVVKKAKELKAAYIKTEGEREGEWVIVDLADVIVHVMLPATREFYNLEDLWESHAHSHSRHRK